MSTKKVSIERVSRDRSFDLWRSPKVSDLPIFLFLFSTHQVGSRLILTLFKNQSKVSLMKSSSDHSLDLFKVIKGHEITFGENVPFWIGPKDRIKYI